jgi:asparagine synthase (glutamine-hydrolysing)
MCGIAGILNLASMPLSCTDVLDGMLRAIFHRGPDEDGVLCDRELAMGMRRLSIIDLADGTQPIFDESGRYAVILNGEIYNYVELRKELLQRGHCLKTHSDTEVIVHLYEEFGERCVDHLRGMFAFAVWDNVERELFIARDRMGEKPLYYCICDDNFLFASEVKALFQHPGLTASINPTGLAAYLSLKYVPAPMTMFAGIQSLPPAHWIKIRRGQISVQRYWDVSYEKRNPLISEEQCIEELDGLLRESIGIRLRSDVPFGAFLSGGIDSSVIVAIMSQLMNEPVKTFSVGFDGSDESDELPFAKMVADRYGCEHHTLKVTGQDFLNYAETVLWHLDQPIADQATVATFMVAKLARQHVKMVLTGEGGDELFGGYARYVGNQWAPWFGWLPSIGGRAVRSIADRIPGMRRGRIAIGALTHADEATRYANWFPMFHDDVKHEVMSATLRNSDCPTSKYFAEHLTRSDAKEPLDRMLYVDCNLWLPDYLLLRGDKLTMANALEARIPFLDHRLVEYAAGLPTKMKVRGRVRKYLLKKVAARYLPDEIIHRRKQGFPIPVAKWLREEAQGMMLDLLSEETIKRRGLFNTRKVSELVRGHLSGAYDYETELWGLMSVEMWMQRFCDRDCRVMDVANPQSSGSLSTLI